MPIDPTTHGMNHVHDVDLLNQHPESREDVRAPAHRCVFPTRDRSVDLAGRRERDKPFPIRGQAPHVSNRLLPDVLLACIQEGTRRGERFHWAGRNHWRRMEHWESSLVACTMVSREEPRMASRLNVILGSPFVL
jgi:hypothetical protein